MPWDRCLDDASQPHDLGRAYIMAPPPVPDHAHALSQLSENRALVLEGIARATRQAGREPESVQLLAVTKSVSPEVTRQLFELGEVELAENRVPAFEEKAAWFADQGLEPRWHFIGHLQRNKARRVVRLAQVVHSVDSLRLLEALERLAAEEGRRLEVYLQVNAAREEQKHGLDPGPLGVLPAEAITSGELGAALELATRLEHLVPVGLMAMGPLAAGRSPREVFDEVAGLAAAIAVHPKLSRPFPGGRVRLSLGMSGDLAEAIAAGSDLVRVGSALFEAGVACIGAEVARLIVWPSSLAEQCSCDTWRARRSILGGWAAFATHPHWPQLLDGFAR